MTNPNALVPDSGRRAPIIEHAGQKLKNIRMDRGLSFRDVEELSGRLATRKGNADYQIGTGSLSDIEKRGTSPSICRLYTLCAIYGLDLVEVLAWYGIRSADLFSDGYSIKDHETHLVQENIEAAGELTVPLELDPGLDMARTTYLTRMIQAWGSLPFALLRGMDLQHHRYGYIGSDDWSMAPVLMPGSLLLIDESDKEISNSTWTNEYERPIYLFEHEHGFTCSWCSVSGRQYILQPHTLSGAEPKVFDKLEVEVVGRVTGVAMRLNLPRPRRIRP